MTPKKSKTTPRIPRQCEDLFTLLDDRYRQYFGNKPFWKQVQAIDAEVTPGCISIEPFKGEPAKHVASGESTSEDFSLGYPTVVFRCKTREGTFNAARVLNKIFDGCGTKFVPEMVEKDGNTTYQIRSNIGKAHWEKLCVFCTYRFDREITDETERKKYADDAQKLLNQYTEGTSMQGWEATTGIPIFCAVMGLHGNLRPVKNGKRYLPNIERVETELNAEHPRGTPLLFQGILMHANMKRSGEISCTTPYEIGFDTTRHAIRTATDGYRLGLVFEMLGGNPFDKHSAMTRRAISGVGLTLGLLGIYYGVATEAIAAVTLGSSVFLASYAHHKWTVVKRLDKLRKSEEQGHKVTYEKKKTIEIGPLKPQVDPIIHEAYTRGGGPAQRDESEVIAEAFSAPAKRQLVQAILEAGGNQSFADTVEAGTKTAPCIGGK